MKTKYQGWEIWKEGRYWYGRSPLGRRYLLGDTKKRAKLFIDSDALMDDIFLD